MRAAVYLILANLFWAGNFVVGQAAMKTMEPLQLTFWRWVLAAVPLLVLAHAVEKPDWRAALRRWPVLLLLSGLGMSGYTLLLYSALQHTSALNASLVTAANPALILVMAVVLLRDRPRPLSWVGVALGLLGVLIVLTAGSFERLLTFSINTGELLIVGAITVWGLYTIIARRLDVPAITSTAVQVAMAAVVLLPFAVATGSGLPGSPSEGWSLAFIAVFPSLGSYLLWNLALKRTSAANAGNYLNLIAVFTAVITVVLGQPITVPQILGGALVISGVLLTSAGGKERQRPRSSKSTSSPPSPSPAEFRPR
ncbi:DMT family transporter [Pseudarthrobacter phenanthrenivorans]|uniref:DMT(Drug/metabolite transporter) superfamily permease n=1 Tax=Pseudarthrobacter phenanthrenivorans (strain DSM 18606 / JCM 16027 / LMG 23796 / Sphe3) TaxID=930171 RepID=F0M949_PSEPM|nr:DMT family transporter [Pseudarthrobacter phenanthrenivorans]ADX73849.1 DMT(drug/metabolite transporter) superfamily permease [Pseudarthrobacter phenanthrenivorans Sphe3]TPV52020.1 DMT family transporter [Pseudarthrobacter phenanthrenivorans]